VKNNKLYYDLMKKRELLVSAALSFSSHYLPPFPTISTKYDGKLLNFFGQ